MSQQQNVLVFKLSSGEEIISEGAVDEINVFLSSPCQIISYPDEQTQQMRIGLVPFLPYAKRDGICLSRIGIHMAFPEDSMVRSYKEFTTGIALPDTQIQLG